MPENQSTAALPAGVRATLTLLARIHADLDASAQSGTATRPSTAQHVAAPKRRAGVAVADLPRAS